MDIFRFTNPNNPTRMEQGEIVDGFKSKMWVERYAPSGEFKLVADVSSGVKEKLPIGSFISHTGTTEIMIVENHEISEQKDKESEIVITGRGFETFFENRIVGAGTSSFPAVGTPREYVLAQDYIVYQIVTLIRNHVFYPPVSDPQDSLDYIEMAYDFSGVANVQRSLPRDDLYKSILKLLAIEDLGIRIVRPGPWSPLSAGNPNTAIQIHKGADRSDSVVFSRDTGDIENADYLWSNKSLKNTLLLSGRWVETRVDDYINPKYKYDRRMMLVDTSDIDGHLSDPPVEPFLTDILIAMQQRGRDVLTAQKEVAITRAEVSKNNFKAKYRTDFDVGDLITVSGSFNESTKMRVSEYVEIEDETGTNRYPTLTTV